MPTYEYVCEACEHRFERFQKMSDRPVRACPECGARKPKRLISPGGGLLFKGPGFYATDYRKGSGPDGKAEKQEKKETQEKKQEKKDAGSAKDAGEGTGS